jgi:hypothetical protein
MLPPRTNLLSSNGSNICQINILIAIFPAIPKEEVDVDVDPLPVATVTFFFRFFFLNFINDIDTFAFLNVFLIFELEQTVI